MSRYPALLSDIGFSILGANRKLFKALHLPVISTARPFAFYRKAFFNNRGEKDVLRSLAGKRIVDVGCGLTPFTEDSMFQVCRRHGVDFFGVDPKLREGFVFGTFDRIKSLATGSSNTPRPDILGQEKAIAAFANELPFDDGSVDIVLCSWLLFAWIQEEDALMNILLEFDRVLKPGGRISLYPTPHWKSMARRYPRLLNLLANYKKKQQLVLSLSLGSVPPTFGTHLQK